jgi:hypothetical protein
MVLGPSRTCSLPIISWVCQLELDVGHIAGTSLLAPSVPFTGPESTKSTFLKCPAMDFSTSW